MNYVIAELFVPIYFVNNLYLLRGYRGTFVRRIANTNPVWFEAQEPEDCDNVPEQVNAGKPPRDICANVSYTLLTI